ncbi:MAG: copper amine oxidase N-terminal domain-containing protein [Clostridia bacterium]|nr:copper amine oxidase N-terminal domain-containing protein [Clostridia bacterium]
MIKKISVLVLCFWILLICQGVVFGDNGISVNVDGKNIQFPDAKPFIDKSSRTLVPVRFVSEALGAKVKWDGKTQKVTITKGKDTIVMKIGEKKALKNNVQKVFDTKAVLSGGRTFVPLRFVSETLGAEVKWIGILKTVVIKSVKINEIEKVIKNIPNTVLKDGMVLFSTKGNINTQNAEITLKDWGKYYDMRILNTSENTMDVTKKILALLYPNDYEDVYVGIKNIVEDGNIVIKELYFDYRAFSANKDGESITVKIGK